MNAEMETVEMDAPEGFAVRDAASANWVIRKVVDARRYAERVETWAAAELRRAQREEEFFLRRFGCELEAWARQQIAQQHDRRKSVCLPAGTVGFRTEPPRLDISDESALLAWCKINMPTAVSTVQSVMKTPVIEHLKITGECPSGAEIAGGGEKFYVK
jgi:phage host-nuclease inhibitor protein Gam